MTEMAAPKVNVLAFMTEGLIVPWDKVCYCERIKDHPMGPERVRIHFVSYGFYDVSVSWDEFVTQVIAMVDAK